MNPQLSGNTNRVCFSNSSKKPFFNGWMCVVLSVAVLFTVTFIWAYQNPYVVRFEMDDNTLEAVKSIDWDAVNPKIEHDRVSNVSWVTCGGSEWCLVNPEVEVRYVD